MSYINIWKSTLLVVKVSERTAAVEACFLCQRRVIKEFLFARSKCVAWKWKGRVTGVTGWANDRCVTGETC